MALTPSATTYLALLSLLVSCVPGLYWIFKRVRRSRQNRNHQQDQHFNKVLSSHQRPTPTTYSLEEYPTHSFRIPHYTVSDGSRQTSNTIQRFPRYHVLVPDHGIRAVWLDTALLGHRPHQAQIRNSSGQDMLRNEISELEALHPRFDQRETAGSDLRDA